MTQPPPSPMTVPKFRALKGEERKITMLTAYDYPTARMLDEAGLDGILVGDSLGMVVQGKPNTLGVTLEHMIYHAEMVCRGAQRALVVVDMPFPTYHLGPQKAIEVAARILQETGCAAVKLEGGANRADIISALTEANIPVMGHCGLMPHSVHMQGGFRLQRDEDQLLRDALAIQQAGAFSMVIECVPDALAEKVSAALEIPTIGIGAGPGCDGQILVVHDLLGYTLGYQPKFVKRYADLQFIVKDAVEQYQQEVKQGVFPEPRKSKVPPPHNSSGMPRTLQTSR